MNKPFSSNEMREPITLGQYLCDVINKEFNGNFHFGASVTCSDKKGNQTEFKYDLMLETNHPFGVKVICLTKYKYIPYKLNVEN